MNEYLIDAKEAGKRLKNGEVGVIPTDTVYGLAASALDEKAVGRLYALKSREQKPGTIIAASTDQLKELGVEKKLLALTENLWPGPISIILPVGKAFAYLHQGVGDIAIRVVDDPAVQKMLEQTGPLVTSSANRPGEPVSVAVQQAWEYFHDTVDFYVDGGDRSGRAPSTIIRLLDDGEIDVIRPGAVKL
jgi:L-threonylcarbamoyladenylate synthase